MPDEWKVAIGYVVFAVAVGLRIWIMFTYENDEDT